MVRGKLDELEDTETVIGEEVLYNELENSETNHDKHNYKYACLITKKTEKYDNVTDIIDFFEHRMHLYCERKKAMIRYVTKELKSPTRLSLLMKM